MKNSHAELSITIGVYLVLVVFLLQMQAVPLEARGYPMFMLIASAIVNTMLFIKGIQKMKKGEEENANQNFMAIVRVIILYIIIMGIYIFLIERISYLASTILFTFASLKFLKVKSRPILILLPICISFLMYFLFTRILMVSLPVGTWFYINL